jgi:CheY-like chemotaxis protein
MQNNPKGAPKKAALILVVEDMQDQAERLIALLKEEGYRVLWAENGNEAMEIFQRKKPDLIITDMVMPEKHGIDAIVEIRRMDEGTKIICISAGDDFGLHLDLEMAKQFKDIPTMKKPYKPEVLLQTVREMIG